jgi:YD repeat-containing protein
MTQNGLYGYDAENRLVNLSGTATYTYDADGQRVACTRAPKGRPMVARRFNAGKTSKIVSRVA